MKQPAVRLIAITKPVIPEADTAGDLIAYVARVSNPDNQGNTETAPRLLDYLKRNRHWSPFEHASMTLEINTTRDIARQILRHRSFVFQEFCVAEGTLVTTVTAKGRTKKLPIEKLYKYQLDPRMDAIWERGVRVYDEHSKSFVRSKIKEVFDTGIKPCYEVVLEDGKTIRCTEEHRFFGQQGFVRLADCKAGDLVAVNGQPVHQSREWMEIKRAESLRAGAGVQWIADQAGCSYHTIRKWLKIHGLQFSKKENAIIQGGAWNKGLPTEQQPMYGKTLGKATREKIHAKAKKGPASHLYKGGVDRGFRQSVFDWQSKWKNFIIKRDGGACKSCGTTSSLEIDHIVPVSKDRSLAFSLENLQVLCRACHKKKSIRETKEARLTIRWKAIQSITYVGDMQTYDLEVEHSSHNYIANGIVTHNSGRYAEMPAGWDVREARLQDTKNRQNSLPCGNPALAQWWEAEQASVAQQAMNVYQYALKRGIAKEVARAILPEGLTPSRLYMTGNVRNWIHYVEVRTDSTTQKEHREVAEKCKEILYEQFPELAP